MNLQGLQVNNPAKSFGISQKLARNSIKYDEMKFFAKVLGYDLKFEKIEE